MKAVTNWKKVDWTKSNEALADELNCYVGTVKTNRYLTAPESVIYSVPRTGANATLKLFIEKKARMGLLKFESSDFYIALKDNYSRPQIGKAIYHLVKQGVIAPLRETRTFYGCEYDLILPPFFVKK